MAHEIDMDLDLLYASVAVYLRKFFSRTFRVPRTCLERIFGVWILYLRPAAPNALKR